MKNACYTRTQWLKYRQNLLPEDVRADMEAHLRGCDRCLEEYLGLIDERDEELALVFLPADFPKRTAGLAFGRRPAIGIALRNYAIAAALTLFLTVGGWFSALSEKVPSALFSLSDGEPSKRVSAPRWYDEFSREVSEWMSRFVKQAR